MNYIKNITIKLPQYVAAGLVCAIWCFVLITVVGRYLTGHSTAWAEELARLFLVWAVFLGTAAGISTGIHSNVGTFVKKLPKVFKSMISILISVLIIAVSLVLIFSGLELVLRTSGDTGTTVLGFERNLFYWPVVVCGILLIANCCINIVEKFLNWRRAA